MRNFRSNPAQRRDHYQELTDKIIAALEAGTAPWRRPWDKAACGGATSPVNAATGHRYRGINLFVLGMSPLAFASNNSRWCSYRQAAARGWQVRKGEKATPVYFYKPIEIEDKTTDGGRGDAAHPDPAHVLGLSRLPDRWNHGACPFRRDKGCGRADRGRRDHRSGKRRPCPDRRGTRAFYNPAFDFVQIPRDEAFHSPELRAATLFHELCIVATVIVGGVGFCAGEA